MSSLILILIRCISVEKMLTLLFTLVTQLIVHSQDNIYITSVKCFTRVQEPTEVCKRQSQALTAYPVWEDVWCRKLTFEL